MGYGISEYPEFVLDTLLELEKKQKEPQAGVLKTDLHLAFCDTFDPREFEPVLEELAAGGRVFLHRVDYVGTLVFSSDMRRSDEEIFNIHTCARQRD